MSVALALGVDSSTQSTKVEARDIGTGIVVARASAPHPPCAPPASEQDPEAWWTALVSAIGVLALEAPLDQVVAMAVGGQQHGLVLVDDDGVVVRPAKLWNDTTSAVEAAELVAELGPANWAEGCGSVPVAAFTITKLAWMARHEPDALARTARVMLPHDYLTWRLTDRHVTDRGDASGTGWFDPTTNLYRTDLLATAVERPDTWLDRLPTVVEPDAVAGLLSPTAAATLGLRADVVVGPGTGDNMAAALGLGLRPGDVAMSLGTSGTVYAVSHTPTADPSACVAGFADASGCYLPLVCTLNATRVTDTMAAWLGTDAVGLSELAGQAPAGSSGVVLVPYFDGERTPNLPDAKGSVFGLNTETSRYDLARAAHDGVLCGLLDGLDALTAAGVDTEGRLHLIGGGARSAAYQQQCADLREAPITIADAEEAVATGAALQAAALCSDSEAAELAAAWSLGAGSIVEPAPDSNGTEIRAAYAAVADLST
ncbi:MAG: xylulokinase [Actinomycetia bacterium]|nr:xylulokinase [Actinomycetes bacterium]